MRENGRRCCAFLILYYKNIINRYCKSTLYIYVVIIVIDDNVPSYLFDLTKSQYFDTLELR